ncbi:MAG: MFS transporter [Dehalococcoidia bacterium]|nr:MFS transporter [Dehalococcoidia bacterium]
MVVTTDPEVAGRSRLSNVLSPLRNRNFSLLLAGRTTSEMGRIMRVFARGWLVLELTGSPFLLALVTSAISWANLFIPAFAGILADRMDRRKLVLYTEFALVVLWTLVSLDITFGWIRWWHLLISSVFSGIIQGFGRTGHQALLGSLVQKKEIPSAVALNDIAAHWPQAVGLAIASALVATIGIRGLFWITTVGQLVTGMTLLLIRWKDTKTPGAKQSVRDNFKEGLSHFKGQPVLIGLVLLGLSGSLIGGFSSVLLPFFARDILGVGASGLGVMMTFNAIGTSIGAAVMMLISNMRQRGPLLMIAVFCYTAFLLIFSRSEVFALSVGLVFGVGLSSLIMHTTNTIMMQLMAPDHLRGRVMGMRATTQGVSFIGVVGIGALAEFVGPANAVFIGASAYGLVALTIFATMPQLRKMKIR